MTSSDNYYVIDVSLPILGWSAPAIVECLSIPAGSDIAFPVSRGLSFGPVGSLVPFFQFLTQCIPWLYVDLWPAFPFRNKNPPSFRCLIELFYFPHTFPEPARGLEIEVIK